MSTHNIPFQDKEEKSALIIQNLPLWDFSKGIENELEAAVVYRRAISVLAIEVLLYTVISMVSQDIANSKY